MVICQRCGKKGGAGIFAHVFLHILDLIIVGVVAAVVTGAAMQKLGWAGVVLGAVMGIGLGSFRERRLVRRDPQSFPLGPPPPAEDQARIQDVVGR